MALPPAQWLLPRSALVSSIQSEEWDEEAKKKEEALLSNPAQLCWSV